MRPGTVDHQISGRNAYKSLPDHIDCGISQITAGPQFHSTLTGHAFGDCRSMRVDTAQFLF